MNQVVEKYKLPLSADADLPQAEKSILCFSWSNSGYRLLTGSSDTFMRIYDFNGMNEAHRPFKEIQPHVQQSVNSISQSTDSKYIFLSTESAQPMFYTQEGKFKIRCVAGDPYIFDNVKTVGHQSFVRQVCYNPVDNTKAMSCSLDCTARIWDFNGKTLFDEIQSLEAIRTKSRRGQKVPITSCCYTSDGSQVLLGTQDGSLQFFDSKNKYARPRKTLFDAHTQEITSIAFDSSNTLFATRSKDNTVKIWDIRKLLKPLKTYDVPTLYDTSNVAFGPKSGVFVVGTSTLTDSKKTGDLWFYDINSSNPNPIYKECTINDSSVVCVAWHQEFNQIVAGCQTGEAVGYYDPQMSKKGFLLTTSRKDTTVVPMQFYDEYKAAWNVDDSSTVTESMLKEVHRNMIHPPAKYNKPEASEDLDKGPNPLNTFSNSNFGTDFIKDTMEDPRQALLRQNDKEDDFITKSMRRLFAKNDPNHIIGKRTLEEDLDEQARINRKRQGLS